jgi:hypothetical protein
MAGGPVASSLHGRSSRVARGCAGWGLTARMVGGGTGDG